MTNRKITVAHSPDSDDAFMFYALAKGRVASPTLDFTHHLQDIETLNRDAREGKWDVTAISFHAYPYVADQYALMPCGGSVGDGYGPLVVSQEPLRAVQLRGKKVAVPGLLTTAFLAMRIYEADFEAVVVPFDQILGAVQRGEVDAGLLIHEGQLTFGGEGLRAVVDLGAWWRERFGLPLPLGGNAIRRALEPTVRAEITQMLRQSIQYGLSHREEAMAYALRFARNLNAELADRFVGMYVNDYTLDYGERGWRAIETLLRVAWEKGIIPQLPAIERDEPER